MNSSTRAKLRSLAMTITPTIHIGKNGLTDTVIAEVDDQLFNKELIKISVLKNADFGAKDIIGELAEQVGAEPIQAIGNKITLYRLSNKDNIKHVL